MNTHTKENCVENNVSAKLPVTGHYTHYVDNADLPTIR